MKLSNRLKLSFLLLLVTLFAFTATSCKQITEYSITIFATNDIHGHFDILPQYETIINQVRNKGEYMLLLDAGDIFKRGPYESYHGKIETELFNCMKYDAMVLGNNEFKVPGSTDSTNSAGSLAESDKQIGNIIKWANFPVLCGNVTLKDSGKYIKGTKPYIIKEVGGLKIGIIGVTNTEAADYNLDMGKDKNYVSGEKAVGSLLPEVKKASDIQIVLSHAGMTVNRLMTGVSAIISGHDHIKLDPPEVSHGTPITQAGGENDLCLYRLDMSFKLENGKWVLKSFKGQLYTGMGYAKNPDVQKIISNYESKPIPELKAA